MFLFFNLISHNKTVIIPLYLKLDIYLIKAIYVCHLIMHTSYNAHDCILLFSTSDLKEQKLSSLNILA